MSVAIPMPNRWLSLIPNLFVLACSACVVDWSARDGGLESDADAPAGDAASAPDAESDTGRDDAGPGDGEAGVEGPDGDDPQTPCSAGCGEHASCDEERQICDCDPDYYDDGSGCVLDPCAEDPCGTNETCSRQAGNYTCRCAQGFDQCGGECVDLQTDPRHCGACDQACAGALTCKAGSCEQAVHELVLGNAESCALLESASPPYPLKCWGDGRDAFYRDGAGTDSASPRDVVGVASARALALSDRYRCIVHPERDDVVCWGSCSVDCAGSLSSPAAPEVLRAIQTDGVRSLAIAEGAFYGATCSLRGTGLLTCMGFAPLVPYANDRDQWTFVNVGSGGQSPRFSDVSGRSYFLCGSVGDDTRRVACWGIDSGRGELGAPAPSTPNGVYVQREGGGDLQGVLATSAGSAQSCSVTQGGKVYCWGGNDYGMLGHGDAIQHSGAVEVVGVSDAIQVAVGGSHSCALERSGEVACWGYAVGAGLGDMVGDMNEGAYFSTAQRVPGLRGVIELRAGNGHTCARLRSGAVMCWGANNAGQVGDGSFITRSSPVAVKTLVRGLP